MAIFRLFEMVLVGGLSGVALVSAVVFTLVVGWLAVAIPTMAAVGLGAVSTALSHRLLGGLKRAAKG
jgi:hypothetical protein